MIAEAWDVLISMTVAASALAVGLLVLRLPLRAGFGARVAYLAWLILPLALLALLLPGPVSPPEPITLVHAAMATVSAVPETTRRTFTLREVGVLLWLGGVACALVVLVIRQVRFDRCLRASQRTTTPAGTPSTHVVVVDAADSGPAVVGFWRPRIVLPDDFATRYSSNERELILAHEGVHLARGDTRINAVVAIVSALNWFNPLIHFAASRLRIDQELACDAVVLAKYPHARRSYAEAMLKVRIGLTLSETSAPALCGWNSEAVFKQRIAMLKNPLPGGRLQRAGRAAVIVLAGFASCLVWATQQTRSDTRESDPGEVMIDVKVDIEVDNGSKSIHLLSASGKIIPMAFHGDGDVRWEADVLPRVLSSGEIELSAVIRRNGDTIAQPTMVLRPGVAGSLELSDGLNAPRVRLHATVTKGVADAQQARTQQIPEAGIGRWVDVSWKSTFTRARRASEGVDRQTNDGARMLETNRSYVLFGGGGDELRFELEVRPLADGRYELLAKMSGEGIPPATEPRIVVNEGKAVRMGVGKESNGFLGAEIELIVSRSTGREGMGKR